MERAVLFDVGTAILALPNWHRPRLLVAGVSRHQRWQASAFYPAFRLRARVVRSIVRVATLLRSGKPYCADIAGLRLRDFWSDVLPDADVLAIRFESPDTAQKWVAQLADPAGNVVAYLKCAWTDAAKHRLRLEYDALVALPPGLGPVPLKHARTEQCDLLLTTAVAGPTPRAVLPPPLQLRRFLTLLQRAPAVALDAHPALTCFPREHPVVDQCLKELSGRRWSVVIQHGDLTPWNLICLKGGGLAAIDWEYANLDGLPGLDLAHYVLQVSGLIYRRSPSRTFDAAVRFLTQREYGYLSSREAGALVRLSALQVFLKFQEQGWPTDDPVQRWRRAIWEVAPT